MTDKPKNLFEELAELTKAVEKNRDSWRQLKEATKEFHEQLKKLEELGEAGDPGKPVDDSELH